jgi:hypothetical protein
MYDLREERREFAETHLTMTGLENLNEAQYQSREREGCGANSCSHEDAFRGICFTAGESIFRFNSGCLGPCVIFGMSYDLPPLNPFSSTKRSDIAKEETLIFGSSR